MGSISKRLFVDVAAVLLSGLLLAGTMPVRAQQPDLVTRDMQDSTLLKKRPRAKRPGPPPKRIYRVKDQPEAPPAARPVAGAEIGVTVWEHRPSLAGDPRDIVHDGGSSIGSLTPERIAGDLELAVGRHFSFAVESSREGYLYVVNQPIYDGGPPRDPALIFPTLRLRGGANQVTGGFTVELPSPYDTPSFFTVRERGEGRLVAEEVIVLVTPKPLDLRIGAGPIVIPRETIAEWERRWGVAAERFDYVEGEGMLYTSEEKAARNDPRHRLTSDGPAPQILFRVPAKSEDPVFLRFRIEVRGERSARW